MLRYECVCVCVWIEYATLLTPLITQQHHHQIDIHSTDKRRKQSKLDLNGDIVDELLSFPFLQCNENRRKFIHSYIEIWLVTLQARIHHYSTQFVAVCQAVPYDGLFISYGCGLCVFFLSSSFIQCSITDQIILSLSHSIYLNLLILLSTSASSSHNYFVIF